MDFEFTEEQHAVSELAGRILADLLTHERLKQIEAGDGFADAEWAELAKAGLLALTLPEDHGGNAMGVFESCLVLEQVGRSVAPLPYLATVVLGAMPIAEFGTPSQQAALLPGVASGETILTAALVEEGWAVVPPVPTTRAIRDGDSWRLSGAKLYVPWADRSTRILVPAATDAAEVTMFLVDPTVPGVRLDAIETTNGEPQSVLGLTDVVATDDDVLGTVGQGTEIQAWVVERATVAVCATQAGVCMAALQMIGTYTSEREQFETPIATFQAVAHRAADAYTDAHGVQFTAWQAAWQLDAGLDAADAIDVAKYWTAEGGQRVVHAAQHLHGGIGVDKDYPLHRYFLWAKLLELSLGGATEHLRRLGERLAAGAP